MSKTERDHPASQYGTDTQFLNWISYQPSVLDGTFNQYNPDRNIACHVRRLKFGAGRGFKPPFSAVPMTHRQHMLQEGADGQVLCLRKYKFMIVSATEAAEWFEEKAADMLADWIRHRKIIMQIN